MRRRIRTSAYLAGLTALALTAGCASVPPGHSGPGMIRLTLGPPGGSPALARDVGEKMLASLVLPAGSRRIGRRAVPQRFEVIGTPNLADVSRFYAIPLPMDAVASFLGSHVAAGAQFTGTGTGSIGAGSIGAGSSIGEAVSYALKTAPAGIAAESMLLASLATRPDGGTVLRADAEVVWYPPRSAAEYLTPSAYHAVHVQATFGQRPRTIARTFTSPAVIAMLARLFNGMRTVVPGPIFGCPDVAAGSFKLAFSAAAGRPPAVVVSPAFCTGDLVTVHGRPQPALSDWDSTRALAVIGRLLGVHWKNW